MRRTLPLFLSCFFFISVLSAQTSLGGSVSDVDTGEELIGANIVLKKDGVYATGGSTDFDGNYKLTIDPGVYDMEISYVGYADQVIQGIQVKPGQFTKLDVKMGEGVLLDEIVVVDYKAPLIDQDNTTSGGVITSEQIRNLPTKDITALAATTAGLAQADEGDAVSIRGSRSDGTDFYIDGIRVRGSASLIPQSEIDQLQVITGGIQAQYGDVTGGIISITTKGPSSKFSGGIEVETSEYLDAFGYNLLSANFSGPILKNKTTGNSILGYRLSAQYVSRLDDDPPATDIFRVKEDKLRELEAQPVILIGETPAVAAEALTNDDVEIMKYQPNEESERLDLTAKLDLRVSKAVDLTFTGSYSDAKDRFTPNENTRSTAHWRLFNSQNNPEDLNTRYRGNFRFRHRLGQVTDGTEIAADDADATTNFMTNIQYTLQGGFEKRTFERGDFHHGENLFNYGHVGKFEGEWVPTLDLLDSTDLIGNQYFWVEHAGFQNEFQNYDPSNSANPGLSAYNQYGGEYIDELNEMNVINGINQNPVGTAWGYHTNVNQPYNLYQKLDNDLLTGNVTVNFDLNPGGSDKGTHSVQLGFLYEQRYNRGYDLNPRRLWQLGRQLQNNHIIGIDSAQVVETIDIDDPILVSATNPTQTTVGIHPVITTPQNNGPFATSLFFEEIRELDGRPINAYANIDALNPDQLSIDMFSFTELNSAFSDLNLNFYGFDYRGNVVSNTTTFDDFFTATETINGRTYRSFPVAPINPIYFAGYIQDKFSFKDIIFRVGVRVDRYDANTKVLRDPYSLYNIQSASEFQAANGITSALPGVVEDDYKVYVTSDGGSGVKAYRNGDQWYTNEGVPVNSSTQIFEGVIFPAYAEGQLNEVQNPNFDPDVAFEDYEPQWNVMPRLAFSFPISDDAGFFAHYDILVQRPSAAGINVDRATALNYYNFENTQTRANPNLKPQKTIDYEVGFQQKLTQSSALKIAAYYKEQRDLIAVRTYLSLPSPISSYDSYGNLDFGTVKGFTFQYDLRRTRNIQLQANYTLQFADGTGSDADSQRGLTSRGNIRNLFPLSYDERHKIVTSVDYRYGAGSSYKGPTIGGKNILSATGLNLQMIAVSGRPYTSKIEPREFDGAGTEGQINGSRLPWNTTFNLRLDKSFQLTKADSKFPLNLNVYFRVQNLFDRKNIINIYPATGSPSDDGYLITKDGASAIEQAGIRDLEQAYVDAYNWRLVNPNFFSLPRRIYLGASIDF